MCSKWYKTLTKLIVSLAQYETKTKSMKTPMSTKCIENQYKIKIFDRKAPKKMVPVACLWGPILGPKISKKNKKCREYFLDNFWNTLWSTLGQLLERIVEPDAAHMAPRAAQKSHVELKVAKNWKAQNKHTMATFCPSRPPT